MTKIDKIKPVLITGANGYVASWLVKRLLEEGITVLAAVRNPGIQHFQDIHTLGSSVLSVKRRTKDQTGVYR